MVQQRRRAFEPPIPAAHDKIGFLLNWIAIGRHPRPHRRLGAQDGIERRSLLITMTNGRTGLRVKSFRHHWASRMRAPR